MGKGTEVVMGRERNSSSMQEVTQAPPRCLAIASKGITTGGDFAKFMSAMMSDIVESRITPQTGNAACNAGGKLLKVVEMQYKYGTQGKGNNRVLELTVEEDSEDK